ncbi:MAG: GDP-L-fucose synthase [Deltaproteobacteria bacterium]|nr:GDP-L-fucose synthase [Deltaproteobacteria bacterium]
MTYLTHKDKIFIAGHKGLVGSAIMRNLESKGYTNIVTKARNELDLLDQHAVKDFYRREKPSVVFIAAAKVGGIYANSHFRAEFIYENLQIQNNLIWGAYEFDVHRLVFLGSSCIYPKEAPQPIRENCLLTSPLEYTNRPYAVAKIAGIELVSSLRAQFKRDFFAAMPTNLYGPHDNFHPKTSHVLPALLRRLVEAKENDEKRITVWGTGRPQREFLYSDDCADALVHMAEKISESDFDKILNTPPYWCSVNVGGGDEVSIRELAEMIAKEVEFSGKLEFDPSQPDGTMRKLMDSSLLVKWGWKPKITLEQGIRDTINWYKKNRNRYQVAAC